MVDKKNNSSNLTVINGDLFVDDRGVLRFVNDFDFSSVKRFYQVENVGLDVIRAFHGHQKEGKYVYVARGSVIFCAVKLDNLENPSKFVPVERFILSDKKPQIIYVPPMHANGFRALEKDTQVIFFSTSTLEESRGDDYRFPVDYWGDHIWRTENR